MARQARFVAPNIAHHVVARGVNGCRLFRSGRDKARYLKHFATIAEEEGVLVHAYCLMNNHVHWILTPRDEEGLARLFHRMHTWWAIYFNRVTNRTGHLFQDRFHSTPMEEKHYWAAIRYTEMNPRRAGFLEELEKYEYSSAKAHLSGKPDEFIKLDEHPLPLYLGVRNWRELLLLNTPEVELQLRRTLSGNRPCGSAAWVQKLEQSSGRQLAWRPPGRPRCAPITVSGAAC